MKRRLLLSTVVGACTQPPRIPDDFLWIKPPASGGTLALAASRDANDGDLIALGGTEEWVGVSRIAAETGDVLWRYDAHAIALQLTADGHPVVLVPYSEGGFDVFEVDSDGQQRSTFRFEVFGRVVSFAVGGHLAALLTCSSETLCHFEVRRLGAGELVWAKSFVSTNRAVGGDIAVTPDGVVAHAGYAIYDATGAVTKELAVADGTFIRTAPDGGWVTATHTTLSRLAPSGSVMWSQPLEGTLYDLAVDLDGQVDTASWQESSPDNEGEHRRFAADGTLERHDAFFTPAYAVAVGRHTFVAIGTAGVVALP